METPKVYKIKDLQTGEVKEFVISPMVPVVTRKIIKWVMEIVGNLKEDVLTKLKEKKFKSNYEMFDTALYTLIDLELDTHFLALVTRPYGVNENEKDIRQMVDYYEKNLKIEQEIRLFHNFFTSISIPDIMILVRSISEKLQKALMQVENTDLRS